MKRMKWEEDDLIEQDNSQVNRHKSFVEVQNTCPLCNSQLTIRVESYLENYTLREEATCPKCQVLARVKDHKMH
jgi:hypothetical protein